MPTFINRAFIFKFLLVFIVTGHIMLAIQNYKAVIEGVRVEIPFSIIYQTLFSFSTSFSTLGFIIFLTNIILMSYLITSIITLYKIEKQLLAQSHKLGWVSMLAIIGSHCASCGSAILGGIFGTTLATVLPLGGVEFAILASIILIHSSYKITKKLINPYVC
jgi:hypothetical protein